MSNKTKEVIKIYQEDLDILNEADTIRLTYKTKPSLLGVVTTLGLGKGPKEVFLDNDDIKAITGWLKAKRKRQIRRMEEHA